MIKTTVKIEGLMCHNCEAHVNDAVKKAFKVKSVVSSHESGETVITSKDAIDAERLTAVITEAGYKPLSVESSPMEKKSIFSFKK